MARSRVRRLGVHVAAAAGLAGVLVASAAATPARRAYQPVKLNVPAQLPDAETGSPYSYSFAGDVSGGTGPPYNWNVKGSLPSGLHLNGSTGTLGGTVSKSARVGSYGFTVCATGRKRPVGGSAPGNTACDSTRLAVAKGASPTPPTPKPAPSFNLAASPPGVNVTIDGPRQTTVIAVAPVNGFTGKVAFSTVGTTPTGLSIQFLAPPAGTQGTTLSLAAAQDATEGNYQLTILGTSGSLTAQTVVTVTINEPDFSGTYTGTWSGRFTSSQPDRCVLSEGGRVTVTVVKALPAGYTVTFSFEGRVTSWSATCGVTATTTDTFTENASYSNGQVVGTTFTITGNSLSGKRVDNYPGGTDETSFMAQR